MKSRRMWYVIIILAICFLPVLWGCGGGGSDGGGSDGGSGEPANPAFNGTFRGNLTSTQGGQRFTETTTVTLTVGSPVSGTFTSDSGQGGTISGEATGNEASFATNFSGSCPGSSEGTATLVNDNTLSVELSGSDCGGPFTTTGTLNRIPNPTGSVPEILGVYTGTATETHTNCDDPADNGTFSLPVAVDISSQDLDPFLPVSHFSGTFTAEGTFGGADVIRISATLDNGLLNADETVSGTYTSNLFINDTFDSSGEGTFSGTASGVTFDISYSGMDVVGDSCDIEGSINSRH